MRLCRFRLDELDLIGIYFDDRVVPIDQACEIYCQETGDEQEIPSIENLLDLLPPDGPSYPLANKLANWLEDLDESALDELSIPLDELDLLVPVANPGKIFLLAGNYAAHVAERGGVATERNETFPYVFMKPGSTLNHPGAPIILPRISPDHIDWECELGVVIGRTCRRVDEAEALEYVAGYTVINDISDRQFRPNPERTPRDRDRFFDWLHGKWHDTFCPMGPCILSADAVEDPQSLPLKLTVNGEVKQKGSTAQMIFPVPAVVSFLSQFVTLHPGDIISTGTPDGVGSATGTYLNPGDVVAATIGRIGTLENPVEAEDAD